MGMFDTLKIHKHHIDPLLEESWKRAIECYDGYYLFQTKDLECVLQTYTVEQDGKVYSDTYNWNETTKCIDTGTPERSNITEYVNFYDLFHTNDHQIFIEFKALFVDGVLHEIVTESVEQKCLKEIKRLNELNERKWKYRETLWEMRLFRFMQNVEWKFNRLLRPLTIRWVKLLQHLMKQAEQRTNQEINSN